jgi:hypothetical protein
MARVIGGLRRLRRQNRSMQTMLATLKELKLQDVNE